MEICERHWCGVILCLFWMSCLVHTVRTSRRLIYHHVLKLKPKARVYTLLRIKVSQTGNYISNKICVNVKISSVGLGRFVYSVVERKECPVGKKY
jgi:hypothetical protein